MNTVTNSQIQAVAKRREAYEFARGSVRFEGMVCSAEATAIHEKWVRGELSSDECTAALLSLYQR